MSSSSILGSSDGDDLERQAVEEVRLAGRNDWRAAAWMLERHPTTRKRYGDPARLLQIQAAVLSRVVKAIDEADLPTDVRTRLLLEIDSRLGTSLYADSGEVEL